MTKITVASSWFKIAITGDRRVFHETGLVMKTLDLIGLTEAELSALVGTDVVLLAGSGVSIWEPTGLPTGFDFSRGTFDALFRSPGMLPPDARDDAWLEAWFLGRDPRLTPMPFEVIVERCPSDRTLASLLAGIYSSGVSNPVHDSLARLATTGRVRALITTNYDCGLDTALVRCGSPLVRVLRESDAVLPTSRMYLKIHGTAEPGQEDTLIYRLRNEGSLPQWKRKTLQDAIRDRALLVIGYSGVDFDICPEVPAAHPRVVLWNFRSPEDIDRSPGLKRLRDCGTPCIALVGDMLRLLELLDRPVVARKAAARIDIATELRARFDLPELLLWRARVLNSIGHARLASTTLKELPEGAVPAFDVGKELAQAAFHGGAYWLSARLFLKATGYAPDEPARRLAILDAADAIRCYGDVQWGARLVDEATNGMDTSQSWADEVAGVSDLKRILLLRDDYEMARAFVRTRTRRRIRREARTLFERAARTTLLAGRWYEFQQLSLWAQRMSVAEDLLRPPGLYAPLTAQVGYRHLGYPVGLAMEACDRGRRHQAQRDELEYFLELMEMLGCAPQSWKVALALARRYPVTMRRSGPAFLLNFARCEYTLGLRVAWLIRGS